ncbi:2-dehydropantoate 2-reductase-like protein [Coniochaeta sp. 2T2.1]|nr:2-dehydropantoate 2-reductase-like protein [Coniochaeta sp. 2T2.1]
MNVCSVGGNAVSAFLSWRLQATNACDVTLVWKNGYEHVSQYGISFKSNVFGNERFKPRHVVKSPEDAATLREGAYDYVILCVKALPDIYDLASVIDSVVTPQHTCILINTTNSLGVESAIEERFPTNVVLSLVCGAEIAQLGGSEFEHKGSTEVWVGPANKNAEIPPSIQEDMAQALAMTLSTGQVDCKVSNNIRQQQYERVIGPIAFYPACVIFEQPKIAALLEKVGVLPLVSEVIDELLALATSQGCKFPDSFKQRTIEEMSKSTAECVMYQDYVARRPMEVETYLGSPMKLAQLTGVKLPRIETLYAILHHLNQVNLAKPKAESAVLSPPSPNAAMSPIPRNSSQPMLARPMPNGMPPPNGMPRQRPRGGSGMGPPPPGMRRGPPSMNGGPPNGYGRPPMNGAPNGGPGSRIQSRRGSMEGGDLDEFSHLVLYDDIPEGGPAEYAAPAALALKERELALRQRELQLREQEMRMRGSGRGPPPGPRRGQAPPSRSGAMFDDEDEDEDYIDPTDTPPVAMIDPDNFDMMSVTSRKNRKVPSQQQIRKNPEYDGPPSRGGRFRPSFSRNRSSQIVNQVPGLHDNIMDDPLLSSSTNRYGAVDRGAMHAESRTNSLTSARLDELQYNQGPPGMMNGAFPRRSSQSPGNPYSPSVRGGAPGGPNGRPSPPNGYPGQQMNGGRPSPPNGVRQPVPRYPPGHGNAVAPQQVEQHAGVSALQPPKGKIVRSLTGSASASAGSGDSLHLDSSEPSAHSSQSSLGPRPPIGVR